MNSKHAPSRTRGSDLLEMLSIGSFVGIIFGLTIAITFAVFCLPNPTAVAFLATQVTVILWPRGKVPWWGEKYIHHAVTSAQSYFPCSVTVEDEAALKPGRPYVVGLEPHSALPSALPAMFNSHSGAMPKALQHIKVLAISTVAYLPATRHLWWWLGVRSIDKETFRQLLATNNSVVLVPGGVSECMIMEQGKEVMWLKNRLGFVRLAMQHGAPLVPAFAFGQSKTYSWYRPGPPFVSTAVVQWIRKRLGYVPLLMWGRWGTFVPHKVPMHLVIGKPIEVPHIADPRREEVQKYLDQFIHSIVDMYHRHRDAAGYGNVSLEVV